MCIRLIKAPNIALLHRLFSKESVGYAMTDEVFKYHCYNNYMKKSNYSLLQNPILILSIAVLSCVISLATLMVVLQKFSVLNNPVENVPSFVTIPFTGVLKNIDGTVVDSKRDIFFRLYSSELGNQPVYIGECIGEKGLTPEYDGSFTIVLGTDCGMPLIPQELLDTYDPLYLGVQIGSNEEIVPRTLISTGAHLSVGSIAGTIPESDQGGNILFQPAIGANTLISSGKLGIGILEPQHKLSVFGIEPYESIMSVVNISPEDIGTSSVLDLSLGTPSDGNNATFVNFIAGASREAAGTNVGRIRLGNGGVVYETKGADFAEYFDTENKDLFAEHMIVGINTNGIFPATKGDRFIGVISDTPGFVGNSQYDKPEESILVGIVGQVTVLVSTENGPIHRGDVITIGSIAGYGAKRISNISEKIGIALEDGEDVTFTQEACPYMYYIREGYDQKYLKCGNIRILLDTTR